MKIKIISADELKDLSDKDLRDHHFNIQSYLNRIKEEIHYRFQELVLKPKNDGKL